jgi:hypothetical protein
VEDHKEADFVYDRFKSIAHNKPQLRIPIIKLLQKAVDNKYAVFRKNNKAVRGTSCRRLCSFDEKYIVQLFDSIIRGNINYYSCCNQRSDM